LIRVEEYYPIRARKYQTLSSGCSPGVHAIPGIDGKNGAAPLRAKKSPSSVARIGGEFTKPFKKFVTPANPFTEKMPPVT
jgi:hypothetical protein